MFTKFNNLPDTDKSAVLYIVQKARREYLDRQEADAKREREYDKEVREWYRKGDGRSREDGGRGYAYPYCIHGVYILTDYDIPCWRCEAGDWEEFDYIATIRWTVGAWQRAKAECDRRRAALNHLVEAGYSLGDIPAEMTKWASAPVVDILG